MNTLPCKHLRMKRLFVPDRALDAFAPSETREAVCQCWCNQTMTGLGRDDRHVSQPACTDPQRPCYRPF